MVGAIILGLSALATIAIAVAHYFAWRNAVPTRHHRGIGIEFEIGAIEPWPGLDRTIDAILDTLAIEYPSLKLEFWIRVVPNSGIVRGCFMPEGMTATGKQLNGTIDGYAAWLGAYRREIIVVRQLLDEQARVLPAESSALIHEVAEHLVPFLRTGDWNSEHRSEWTAVSRLIESKLK